MAILKKLAFLLVLSLSANVFADQVSTVKWKGLNNNSNSVIIDPSEAQDLLNVDVTPTGQSVKKRSGYGLFKALSTNKPIHGLYHFFDSTGNDVQVAGSSTSLYGIVAGGTPIQLISSATLNSIWDCADSQGSAYCVDSNRDAFVKTNGTTMTWYSSPLGTMVETTPDRVVVAGVSGSPNTIYISESNTFTNFTVGINATSPFQEVIASPGSKLTHLRYGCGNLLWWKDQSFGVLAFDDQFNVQIRIVSDTIGTFDNTSAIDPGGNVWFRGQDGHTWKYDCSFLTKESIDITPSLEMTGRQIANAWTQSTQADFASGLVTLNGPTISLSTSSVSGSVVPSTVTVSDTDASDFNLGSGTAIDTTTVSGSVTLKTYFSTEFGSVSEWTNYGSATLPAALRSYSNKAGCDTGACGAYSNQTVPNDFVIRCRMTPGTGAEYQCAALNSSNAGYAIRTEGTGTGSWSIMRTGDFSNLSNLTTLCSGSADTSSDVAAVLTRDSSTNLLTLYLNGVSYCSVTDATTTSFSRVGVRMYPASNGVGYIDDFYDIARVGSFTSRAFDTLFSTPIYGTFNSGTANIGAWSYATRCSNSISSGYTSDVSVSTGSAISGCNGKRYIVYSSTLTASSATSPSKSVSLPQISDVSIFAASTGTYYSSVKNTPNLSSWGTLGVNSQTDGGTQSFYVRSSTNIFTAASSTPSWVAQTVGGLITASTGTYIQFRSDFSVSIATATTALNDFTLNWFEGSASDQSYMLYFDNAIWKSVAFGSGQSTNNYIFKKDLINDAWTAYNFGAGGLAVQSNRLYFGDTSSGNVYIYGSATSDNGSAISAYWKGKDFTGQDPFLQNQLNKIDVFCKKDHGTILTGTYTTDTSTATAYSISLSTSSSVVQNRKLLPSGKLGYTMNYKLSDNSSSSAWECMGYRMDYTPLPYRPTPP